MKSVARSYNWAEVAFAPAELNKLYNLDGLTHFCLCTGNLNDFILVELRFKIHSTNPSWTILLLRSQRIIVYWILTLLLLKFGPITGKSSGYRRGFITVATRKAAQVKAALSSWSLQSSYTLSLVFNESAIYLLYVHVCTSCMHGHVQKDYCYYFFWKCATYVESKPERFFYITISPAGLLKKSTYRNFCASSSK